MATAQRILVDHNNVGLLGEQILQTEEAAGKVTELLQRDLEASWHLRNEGVSVGLVD